MMNEDLTELSQINISEITKITIFLVISKTKPCKLCDELIKTPIYLDFIKASKELFELVEVIFDWVDISKENSSYKIIKENNIQYFPSMKIEMGNTSYIVSCFWTQFHNENKHTMFLKEEIVTFLSNIINHIK